MNKLNRYVAISLMLILITPAHAFSLKRIWGAIKELQAYESNYLPSLNDINSNTHQALNTLNAIQKDMEGHFGYGDFLNTDAEMKNRLWSNDSWVDVLKQTKQAHPLFLAAMERYAALYPTRDANTIRSSLNEHSLIRRHYDETQRISRAALASSSYSYDTINNHIRELHTLIRELEKHAEAKASLDLNARLIAELGFIQLEMLRQQSVQNQLLATHTQSEVNGLSDESNFLQWPSF